MLLYPQLLLLLLLLLLLRDAMDILCILAAVNNPMVDLGLIFSLIAKLERRVSMDLDLDHRMLRVPCNLLHDILRKKEGRYGCLHLEWRRI